MHKWVSMAGANIAHLFVNSGLATLFSGLNREERERCLDCWYEEGEVVGLLNEEEREVVGPLSEEEREVLLEVFLEVLRE